MNEAVRTTASPLAIWVIVAVMSVMTMILVSAAAVADSWQARIDRRARGSGMGHAIADVFTHTGSLGADDSPGAGNTSGTGAGVSADESTAVDSVAAGKSTEAGERGVREPVPAQRSKQPAAGRRATAEQPDGQLRQTEADPEGEPPTLPDLPPVAGRRAMPAPRRGDADRPERSRTGTSTPEDGGPGQR